MKGKFAILLVRVSTEIQDYEPQIHDLEAYAREKGYTKLKRIETKESGLADSKSKLGLATLYDFIQHNPQYDTVFATELSRLARRQSILHEIKEWLVTNRIQLFLKDTGYSLFDENGKVSAAGEIMFTLYGYFAESEMKQKKERFARSKKKLMEMGLSISGKTLFGYDRIEVENERTTLIPNKQNAEIVRTLYSWYLNGITKQIQNPSIKVIALECIKRNYPSYTHSKRNINKLLKEQGYTGSKITNNKRKNPNYSDEKRDDKYITSQNRIKYPPIIDSETFIAVQQKLKINNSKSDKSSKHTTILARKINCYACGSHLNGDYRVKDGIIKHTYRCSSRAKANPCKNKQTFGMVMLDSVVWSLIKTDLRLLADSINKINPDEDYALIDQHRMKIEKRIKSINEETEELKRGIKANIAFKNIDLSDVMSSFHSKIGKLDKEKGEMEKELSRLNSILLIKKDEQSDIHEVITKNLTSIEKSKDLLKTYINYFVKSIDILFHNTKFTALKVNFIVSSNFEFLSSEHAKAFKYEDGEYSSHTYVVIDKTNTLKIRTLKSLTPLDVNSENQVVLRFRRKLKLEDLFNICADPKRKKELPENLQVKLFKYDRLPVYN
jgi:DNA invertase Pin-like site-specific DNA recombinase